MSDLAPHPLPPANFGSYDLPLTNEPGPWLRIHGTHPDPLYFGPGRLRYRYDDTEKRYGVLYAARRLAGSFIEVYGDRRRYRSLAFGELRNVLVSQLRPKRPACLVDIRGAGLAQLPGNPDGRLSTGDYAVCRAWARAFHEHPSQPDGILYRARHNTDEISVALFDRFADQVEVTDTSFLLNHQDLDGVLSEYNWGLVGSATLKP